ncbi:hypothetical protein NECAME_08800 [Necator americanus]|uniref:FAD dependent oxidoreductase domain-containing protein n=1 Tax=Necator americanus TaxID=51031 RepID=W2TGN5_NECAM|nr:hypothetical protein NECAME_08800 [Necator americanus]ETN80998.1 hypothetical protein NECAME_08800 [Necator americanus]
MDPTLSALSGQVASRYPQFTFDSDWAALIDPMGGILYADKCEVSEEIIELRTSKGLLHSKKAIFTVGPWIKEIFPQAPLRIQPESIAVCYWRTIRSEDTPLLECDKFPVFIVSGSSALPQGFFGLPSHDYDGCAKICFHSGEHTDGPNHPDVVSQEFIDRPAEFIRNHIPIIDSTQPVQVDKCKYTMSEDNHYVVGYYPGSKKVLIGGCGSGSGFKVAPGIGRILAEMAADEKPSIDVSFFGFDRFSKKSV